jgi:hypothetical protein
MSGELHTFITALLPPSRAVRLTEVTVAQEYVLLQLTAMVPTTCYLRCTMPSSSVHSRNQRQLADLSWGALAVRVQLTVRKFVCRHPSYGRRIFTERLPELVALYARKTTPLVTSLQAIGTPLPERPVPGSRLAYGCRPARPPCSGWYGWPRYDTRLPCRLSASTSGPSGGVIATARS